MTDTPPERIWADLDGDEFTDIEPEGTFETEYIHVGIHKNALKLAEISLAKIHALNTQAATDRQTIETLQTEKGKRAPVQGFSAGIPWEMHLRAYDGYCKKYRGGQQALIEGGCRGGFSVGELDIYIPGWRDEVTLVASLQADNERLREALTLLIESADAIKHWHCWGRSNEGMVVSAESVHALWNHRNKARAALQEGKTDDL